MNQQPATLTKAAFLANYREHLSNLCDWAKEPGRLDKFMNSVEITLRPGAVIAWNNDSEIARMVWKQMGGQGRMTYKALKALPERERK